VGAWGHFFRQGDSRNESPCRFFGGWDQAYLSRVMVAGQALA